MLGHFLQGVARIGIFFTRSLMDCPHRALSYQTVETLYTYCQSGSTMQQADFTLFIIYLHNGIIHFRRSTRWAYNVMWEMRNLKWYNTWIVLAKQSENCLAMWWRLVWQSNMIFVQQSKENDPAKQWEWSSKAKRIVQQSKESCPAKPTVDTQKIQPATDDLTLMGPSKTFNNWGKTNMTFDSNSHKGTILANISIYST